QTFGPSPCSSACAPLSGFCSGKGPSRQLIVRFRAVQFCEVMRSRRYTVLIADRSSGVVRRVTVSLRPALAAVFGILMLPILMGLGAKWSAKAEIGEVRSANLLLQEENGSYRAATGALTGQIQSLESVINEL